MSFPKSRFCMVAVLLLVALFATNVYRAATQSVVHDEALSWQEYLSGPASVIFNYYDANNHFLATLLFRLSTTIFGDSALAMRLPTLLAGAWFFWTIFQMCALLFGDGWMFLLGCAVLSLNPFLLDFLVAARGYGLAIAGLFWALFEMLSWLDERAGGTPEQQLRTRLWKAAAGCSVAVASNLTFLMPAFVLAVAFCFLLLSKPAPVSAATPTQPVKHRKTAKKSSASTPKPSTHYGALMHFLVPVAVFGLVFLLAAPIDMVHSQDLYAGASDGLRSLQNLVQVSFAYGEITGPLQLIEHFWSRVALFFIPIVVLASIVLSWPYQQPRPPFVIAAWLSSLMVLGSAMLLVAAHLISGLPYPQDRTGIYFVPLACLAALGLSRMLLQRSGFPRYFGLAAATVLAAFAIEFAAQWNVRSFLIWRYDADTNHVFQAIESASNSQLHSDNAVRLGVSWQLEPALNYYRAVKSATWMSPVRRDGFDGNRTFYVVTAQDQPTVVLPNLKPIYRGPVSGTLLAAPSAPR